MSYVEEQFAVSKAKMLARIACISENLDNIENQIAEMETARDACCPEDGWVYAETFPIEGETAKIKDQQ